MAHKTSSLLKASCIAAISSAFFVGQASAQDLLTTPSNASAALGEFQLAQTIIVVDEDGTTKKKKRKRKKSSSGDFSGDSGSSDGSHGGSFKM